MFFRKKVLIFVFSSELILFTVSIKKNCLCITRTAEAKKGLRSAYELVCKYETSMENVNFMFDHNEQGRNP